jgi:hypothetical protein
MINEITRSNLPGINAEVLAKLREFCAENGLRVETKGNTRYDAISFVTKFEFTLNGTATEETPSMKALRSAVAAGLIDAKVLDGPVLAPGFGSDNLPVTVTGYNARAKKYPVIYQTMSGRRYKGPAANFRFVKTVIEHSSSDFR